MRNLTQLLFALFCLCMPIVMHAGERDDSKYLAGAIPEVDGRVIFSKEFSIPGMSQQDIYDRMTKWMNARLAKNANNSRIVFSDKEQGQIVGTGDEWMIFSSTALSLDRTKITYQIVVNCQPEKCSLKVEKIRFNYREGKEKYTAEEWITDKYALNKDKTKLVRGLAKWRRKTVDFVDDLCLGAAEALSASTAKAIVNEPKEEKKVEKAIVNSGTTVITQKQPVAVDAPKTEEMPLVKIAVVEVPVILGNSDNLPQYKEVSPDSLVTANDIQIGTGKLVIIIGEVPFNVAIMTANAGGSLGKINGKPVVFSILSPDQPYEQMEKAENYTINFYQNDKTSPLMMMECKKLPSPAAIEGMPRTYVGEILKAKVYK